MISLRGKVSHFGGPEDMGVSPSEGLAFIYEVEDAPELFLSSQPPGTTGLARRLDPATFYIATRWDYSVTPKTMLLDMEVKVTNAATGRFVHAKPADWGPAGPESDHDTGRVADVSPGVMNALGLVTDDEVIIEYQPLGAAMTYQSIVISSGHGLKIRGASGVLDEVDEARKVVEAVAEELRSRGVEVTTYHDDVSTSQGENLDRIVDFHNSKSRDLDVSVHFNAYVETENPMGTEVLYVTQTALAGDISRAIAEAGDFIDRGAKKRTDLAFLNGTEMPSVLLECCFVDSEADAQCYRAQFDEICEAIAGVLGGAEDVEELPPPEGELPPARPSRPAPTVRIDIEVSGDVTFIINGVPVT